MKKRRLLIALILLAVLGVGLLIYLNIPRIVARNALAGVADDLLDRSELKPLVKMSKKGSLSVSADIDTNAMYPPVNGELYIGEKLDLSLDGKLYFGKGTLFLKNACLDLNGFQTEADLYVGKKYAYLDSDLTGGAVGMIKGEMTEALKSSELAREMPDELYRELLPMMKEYDGISEEKKSDSSLLLEYLAELVLCVEKNADYKSETREVLLQGERVKCRVVTATLDADGVRAVLHRLSEMLSDEAFCEVIDQYGSLLNDLLVGLGILSEDTWLKSPSGALRQWLQAETESWESATDETRVVEIVTPRLSSKLLSLRFLDGDNALFSLDFGKEGAKKTDRITICVMDSTYMYSTANHAEGVRCASLYRELDRGVYPLFSLSIDEQNDSFCLFWRDGGTERYLMGDWIETKKSTTVIAEKFTDAEGRLIDEGFHIELTFQMKDKMPKPLAKKAVRNLFDLTTDDIWEIITKSRGLWAQLL